VKIKASAYPRFAYQWAVGKTESKTQAVPARLAAAPQVDKEGPKARIQTVKRMGVDRTWLEGALRILPGKEKVIEQAGARLAKRCWDTIYLARRILDREGEAIAWHLRESIGGDEGRYKRVVFQRNGTKKAIQKHSPSLASSDLNRVNAQQARRFLDRVSGFTCVSRCCGRVAPWLVAGRRAVRLQWKN